MTKLSRTRISVHPQLPTGLGDNVLTYHSCPEEDKVEQDKDICTSSAAYRIGRQCVNLPFLPRIGQRWAGQGYLTSSAAHRTGRQCVNLPFLPRRGQRWTGQGLGDNVLTYHSCPEEDKDEQDKDICTSSAAHRIGRQCVNLPFLPRRGQRWTGQGYLYILSCPQDWETMC